MDYFVTGWQFVENLSVPLESTVNVAAPIWLMGEIRNVWPTQRHLDKPSIWVINYISVNLSICGTGHLVTIYTYRVELVSTSYGSYCFTGIFFGRGGVTKLNLLLLNFLVGFKFLAPCHQRGNVQKSYCCCLLSIRLIFFRFSRPIIPCETNTSKHEQLRVR